MSGLGWTRLDHTRPEITLKSRKIAAIYIGSTCLTLCDPPWRNIDATASHTNPHRRMSVLCASQCNPVHRNSDPHHPTINAAIAAHRPILTEYWRNSDWYESWMWHLCSKMLEKFCVALRQPKIYWLTLTDTDAAQVKWGLNRLFMKCRYRCRRGCRHWAIIGEFHQIYLLSVTITKFYLHDTAYSVIKYKWNKPI